MKTISHLQLEDNWTCACTVKYSWDTMSKDRAVLTLDLRSFTPIEENERYKHKEAILLNYTMDEYRTNSESLNEKACSSCGRYKFQIIPNPFYKGEPNEDRR